MLACYSLLYAVPEELTPPLAGMGWFVLHGAGGATVSLIVVGTLGLVEGLLGGALAVVGLEAASDTVGGIGEGLLDLVLGGLARVRSDLLLSLCLEKKKISIKELVRGT